MFNVNKVFIGMQMSILAIWAMQSMLRLIGINKNNNIYIYITTSGKVVYFISYKSPQWKNQSCKLIYL